MPSLSIVVLYSFWFVVMLSPLLSNVNENDPILINDYYGEFEKREQHMVEKTKKKYDIHIECNHHKWLISHSNKYK